MGSSASPTRLALRGDSGNRAGDEPGSVLHRRGGEVAVAQDEAVPTCVWGVAVAGEAVQVQVVSGGGLEYGCLVPLRGQFGEQVQTGGRSGEAEFGCVVAQCLGEGVAADAVSTAHGTDVPVVFSGGEEVGEGKLVQDGARVVGELFAVGDRRDD